MGNVIYLYLLKNPILFEIRPFIGFLAKCVYMLDKDPSYLIGVDTKHLPNRNKLPGIHSIIETSQIANESVLFRKDIPEDFESRVVGEPVKLYATEQDINLIIERLNTCYVR